MNLLRVLIPIQNMNIIKQFKNPDFIEAQEHIITIKNFYRSPTIELQNQIIKAVTTREDLSQINFCVNKFTEVFKNDITGLIKLYNHAACCEPLSILVLDYSLLSIVGLSAYIIMYPTLHSTNGFKITLTQTVNKIYETQSFNWYNNITIQNIFSVRTLTNIFSIQNFNAFLSASSYIYGGIQCFQTLTNAFGYTTIFSYIPRLPPLTEHTSSQDQKKILNSVSERIHELVPYTPSLISQSYSQVQMVTYSAAKFIISACNGPKLAVLEAVVNGIDEYNNLIKKK